MPIGRSLAHLTALAATLWVALAPAAFTREAVTAQEGAATVPLAQSAVPGTEKSDRCAMLALSVRRATLQHPATIDDLLQLRDFGAGGLDMAAPPGFTVSPDGTRLAVQVRQAEPDTNTFCQAIFVFDLEGALKSRGTAELKTTIMLGAELARNTMTMYGLAGFPTGTARPLTPQWSPDGRWLAFVQREEGRDGLFVVEAAGGVPIPVAPSADDVETFAWSMDGTTLEFDTNSELRAAERRLAEEGREGHRYDDRFWMLAETRPYPRGDFIAARFRVPIGARGPEGRVDRLRTPVTQKAQDRAWVELDEQPAYAFRSRVHVAVEGAAVPCDFAECVDAGAAWWSSASHSVLFVRREGFAGSLTGVYRWRPGEGRPRRLAVTADAITGCTLAAESLLCGRERSASPRDIVAINGSTGRIRRVVDLNPQWHTVAPLRITRLQWTNRFGIPAIGDLVLPEHVDPEKPLPLVIVQYSTRGFLRGGTGDEYPIRVIAAAGFAVLSISRPLDYNTWLARNGKVVDQKDLMENWTDRASAHDSILQGLERVAGQVPLDREHLAITGLSDGASSATYALIHSRLFSLALLSTCCEDPDFTTTGIGPAYEVMLRTYEYPVPWQDHLESWERMSPALNASRICAQIQVQAADREARMALTSLVAWRQAGIPAEMYTFPDEYHVKWQPAHRAAVYRRNIETLRRWRSVPRLSCRAP